MTEPNFEGTYAIKWVADRGDTLMLQIHAERMRLAPCHMFFIANAGRLISIAPIERPMRVWMRDFIDRVFERPVEAFQYYRDRRGIVVEITTKPLPVENSWWNSFDFATGMPGAFEYPSQSPEGVS